MNVNAKLIEQVVAAMPQAVMLADRAGRIGYHNPAAEELGAGGAGGQTLLDVLGMELADMQAANGGLVAADVELDLASGRRMVADVWACQIGGSDDTVLVIVTDMSGRASMAKRVAVGERTSALGDLAARVAHELNNPLDGVLRYIGLAERVAGPEAAAYLAGARQGLERMARVGRDLVEQGRDAGGAFGEGVSKLIEGAVGAMQPRADAIGVRIECRLDTQAVGPRNLFQVFCNVIKNSLDAMASGGKLSIAAHEDGTTCVVSVSDTGVGLSDRDAEQAFEAFFTTKGSGRGVGLGLAVSREIVARAGGSIAIAARAEGGTEVTIHLPLAPAASGAEMSERKVL